MRLGVRETQRQRVDQGHEDFARGGSRVGLRSEAGFTGDDRGAQLALGGVVVSRLAATVLDDAPKPLNGVL